MKKILTVLVVLFGIYLLWSSASPKSSLVSTLNKSGSSVVSLVKDIYDIRGDTMSLSNRQPRIPTRSICVGEYCNGSMQGTDDYTTIYIPLVTDGGDVGCGSKVFMSPDTVSKTTGVLDATYRTLFELKPTSDIPEDNIRNIIGNEKQLYYDRVTLNGKVASLFLLGTTTYISDCAIPEFRAQIEQAALQFDTVQELHVYLNNEPWDWCNWSDADPSEDGCDQNPKLWVVKK